ncbi:RNA methyltransferase [Alphaproteobacteria bacterium]|nr:RNA methyltransferase [Alphaproteobacteria bacterium]
MKIIKPSIVLVRPQLPENIGMVARAMDNFGLNKLYIVNPRAGWPNNLAIKSSANSKKIILNAKIYNNLNKALDGFNYVIATSNRKRFLNKPSLSNVNRLFANFPKNKKVAIIFGPENSGLSNEDLMLSDLIFTIDTSKNNQSLNLSHAVLLMCYCWRDFIQKSKKTNNKNIIIEKKALNKDFLYFMSFLKTELEEVGFLRSKNKSKKMFENIQTLFLRSSLSKIEIQTLWGMIKKLRK